MSDPLQERADDTADLQGIATWEPRSRLDRGIVDLARALSLGGRAAAIAALGLLLLLEIALFGLGLIVEPRVAFYTALSVVPASLIAAFLWMGDRRVLAAEPLGLVAVTTALGGLVAGVPLLVNSLMRPVLTTVHPLGIYAFFFLVVAPLEETVKLLAVRVGAYPRDAFGAVADGAVYGAFAGLGFATVENAVAITQSLLGVGLVDGALTRAAAAPLHVLLSAIAGYSLGLAKFNPDRRGPIVLKGLLLVVLLHGIYNAGLHAGTGSLAAIGVAPGIAGKGFQLAVAVGVYAVAATVLVQRVRRYTALLEEAGGDGTA